MHRFAAMVSLYHMPPKGQPLSLSSKYAETLESDEQAYIRKMKLTEDWRTIDCGWVEKPKHIAILHERPAPGLIPPRDYVAPVLEVSYASDDPQWEIAEGGVFFGKPINANKLRMRSRGGRLTVVLFVVPE